MGNPNMIKGRPSINPSGRPKGTAGLAEYIRSKTHDFKDLIDIMLDIARESMNDGNKISAVSWFADRGLGKVFEQVSDDDKLAMLKNMVLVPKVGIQMIKEADIEIRSESQVAPSVEHQQTSPKPVDGGSGV